MGEKKWAKQVEINASKKISFGKAAGTFLLNEVKAFGTGSANQLLKWAENKETDLFSKVFMESIEDPTNNLLTDLRRRSAFNKIYSGW